MADTNPNTTNPSDATPPHDQRHATHHEMDPALRELVGAAHAASIVMEFAAQSDDAANLVLDNAMAWLSRKLADSAETLEAIHESRSPYWYSHGEAQAISVALAKAERRAALSRIEAAQGAEA